MKSKDEKRFQIIGNIVMIIMTILAVAPLLLVIISSLTDNNTLIRNGYSYFPEKFSLAAYNYIFVENPQVLKAYAISFEPVSYTHLDVYKRQTYGNAFVCP